MREFRVRGYCWGVVSSFSRSEPITRAASASSFIRPSLRPENHGSGRRASYLPDVVLRGLDHAPRIDLGGVGEFLEESFHRRHFERAIEEEALADIDVLGL